MENIKIVECFFSIQGEGFTSGKPRLFIRTSGCNLQCDFCDTKYHTKSREIAKKDTELMQKNKEWCITGGEPILRQENLLNLINEYKPKWVEIETNGTLMPNEKIIEKINQFNISPKEKRFQLLNKLNCEPIILLNKKIKNYIVKFVYSDLKSEDFIEYIVKKYKIKPDKIWIMPKGSTKIDLENKSKEVWDFCVRKKYNFSPRLQVSIFGDKKGV